MSRSERKMIAALARVLRLQLSDSLLERLDILTVQRGARGRLCGKTGVAESHAVGARPPVLAFLLAAATSADTRRVSKRGAERKGTTRKAETDQDIGLFAAEGEKQKGKGLTGRPESAVASVAAHHSLSTDPCPWRRRRRGGPALRAAAT